MASNSNPSRHGDQAQSNSKSRSRSPRTRLSSQARVNNKREQVQLMMATGCAKPDLSRTFAPSATEAALISEQSVQHVMEPYKTNIDRCSMRLTSVFNDGQNLTRQTLYHMKNQEFVQFLPMCVDGMIFLVKFFPHGYKAPSLEEMLARPQSSIGLSLSNKLDVFHRLRCEGTRGDEPKLSMDIDITPHKQHKLIFNLEELAKKNIVFKNLNFGPEDAFNVARCIQINLSMNTNKVWQLHTTGDDEYRLNVYRNGLEFGDMEIYLIEGDTFKIFGADDAPDANNPNSNSSKSHSCSSLEKTEAEDQKEDERPPVLWEYSIKLSLVSLMSRFSHFETWIKKWSIPKAIAMSAPSVLHLNWLAFYVATGQLHDSSDPVWFVKMAHMMGPDERLLQLAIELCIQRLTPKNVQGICALFQNLRLSQGIAYLKPWLNKNMKVLRLVMVIQSNSCSKRCDLFRACKKELLWF